MFLNNMDLESKQQFSLGYYNWSMNADINPL